MSGTQFCSWTSLITSAHSKRAARKVISASSANLVIRGTLSPLFLNNYFKLFFKQYFSKRFPNCTAAVKKWFFTNMFWKRTNFQKYKGGYVHLVPTWHLRYLSNMWTVDCDSQSQPHFQKWGTKGSNMGDKRVKMRDIRSKWGMKYKPPFTF